MPSIHVDNARQGFFEEADMRRVVAHLPEHLRPLVLFAYFTGWRKGEVVALQWKQVDWKAGTVRLEPGTTKNSEGRTWPFAALPELAALLHDQWETTQALQRANGQIILNVFHSSGKPVRRFRKAWLAACRAAGVPGRLFHDLRRTAIRNFERAGVPRSWAMKLSGHRSELVYRRYAIVNEADLGGGRWPPGRQPEPKPVPNRYRWPGGNP